VTCSALMDDQRRRFESEALPYMSQMFPAALRLTRDRAAAEDLLQETFSRAYLKFHLFSPGTNLRAWLHKIMYRSFYSGCRRQRSGPVETLVASPCDEAATRPPWASAGCRSAEEEALENLAASPALRALSGLPDHFKTVIFLADVQGYRYREIAEIMAIPVGTVMSRIHRGRCLLRARLRAGRGHQPPSTEVLGRGTAMSGMTVSLSCTGTRGAGGSASWSGRRRATSAASAWSILCTSSGGIGGTWSLAGSCLTSASLATAARSRADPDVMPRRAALTTSFFRARSEMCPA
jgi:RNA polymerase sigma-70 factor, ECF subfamily